MKSSIARLISRGMDSDLAPREREKLERILAHDDEAARLSRQWQTAGDMLRADAARIKAPDVTVAWQDIRREIRNVEATPETVFTGLLASRFRWAGALAAVFVIGLISWSIVQVAKTPGAMTARLDREVPAKVEWVVAEVPGATTMIYTDTETELTVIWMDLAQTVDPKDS